MAVGTVEKIMYLLSFGMVALPFAWLLLFRIDKGIMLFFAAGVSIQYLEHVNVGSYTALDFVGILLPLALVAGLVLGRKGILSQLLKDKVHVLFFCFLICTFLTGVVFSWLLYPDNSALGFMGRVQKWAKFFNGFIIFVAASSIIKSVGKAATLLNCVLLSVAVPAFIFIFQIFSGQTHGAWGGQYQVAMAGFHHPNVISYAMAFVLPIALFRYENASDSKSGLFWVGIVSILLILISLTFRRTVWVGVFVQVIVWYCLSKKGKSKLAFAYLGILFVLMIAITHVDSIDKTLGVVKQRFTDVEVLAGSDLSNVLETSQYDKLMSGRVGRFRANINYFLEQSIITFVFGNGIGATNYIGRLAGAGGGEHNIYLILLVDFGLIGFILYITLFVLLFLQAWAIMQSKVRFLANYGKLFIILLFSYAVFGMGTHVFYFLTTGIWMFYALAGCLAGLCFNRDHIENHELNTV